MVDVFDPDPVEDEANVDVRRAQLGLLPLAEYAKLLDEQYDPAMK